MPQNQQNQNVNYEQILKFSQEWLESKEFNEQYIQTHHPFPPFLNPKMLEDENAPISYQNIPADFAWQMNLPLPKGYLFAALMMSHSGHASFVRYLTACHIKIMHDHDFDIQKNYCLSYQALLKKQPCVINLTVYSSAEEDYFDDLKKYLYLIHPKTKILCLVRDPLTRLKSNLNNHLGVDFYGEKLKYCFNDKDNLKELENRVVYTNYMFAEFKDRVLHSLTDYNCFRYSDIFEKMLQLGFENFDFLDIQQYIEPEKILNLMQQLSKKYDFPKPLNQEDFTFRWKSSYQGFLPLIYEFLNGVIFLITPEKINNDEAIEISSDLKLDLSWFNQFETGIVIYTQKTNLAFIQQNFDYVHFKLKEFIDKLKEVMEFENQRKTTPLKLIEFFKNHPRHRQLFLNVIQKEIEVIQQRRPDIIENWKDYLNFLKMCKGK